MKTIHFCCVALVLLSGGCVPGDEESYQKQIDEISARYAPDKRTAISEAIITQAGAGKFLLTGETLFPEAKDEITALFPAEKITLIDSLKVLPDIALGEKTAGLITLSVANIRSNPSHGAELITQAIMGTPVRILKKQSDWLYIQTPDHYLGWTNTASVQEMTEKGIATWRKSKRLIFKDMYGIIYESPEDIQPVSDLVAGAIVQYAVKNGSYYKVTLPDGRTGFAEESGFQDFGGWVSSAGTSPDDICETALHFTGLPYLWGGTSSKALDCSGFTRTVYFLNGYILCRDASQQILQGIKVPAGEKFAQVRRGDLLFFGTAEPYRVVHVGIWLGDSEVIHASGFVKTESMDPARKNYSSYLAETFLGEVRRLHVPGESPLVVKVGEHPWYSENH